MSAASPGELEAPLRSESVAAANLARADVAEIPAHAGLADRVPVRLEMRDEVGLGAHPGLEQGGAHQGPPLGRLVGTRHLHQHIMRKIYHKAVERSGTGAAIQPLRDTAINLVFVGPRFRTARRFAPRFRNSLAARARNQRR